MTITKEEMMRSIYNNQGQFNDWVTPEQRHRIMQDRQNIPEKARQEYWENYARQQQPLSTK